MVAVTVPVIEFRLAARAHRLGDLKKVSLPLLFTARSPAQADPKGQQRAGLGDDGRGDNGVGRVRQASPVAILRTRS